jgi:hypothetical protein
MANYKFSFDSRDLAVGGALSTTLDNFCNTHLGNTDDGTTISFFKDGGIWKMRVNGEKLVVGEANLPATGQFVCRKV